MSRIRWSTWAASLSKRRRRLTARTAGLSAVLARPQAAGRTVRERWTFSARTLRPRIHLAIQPLLRFDLRPVAVTTSQVFHQHPSLSAPQILHWMTRHESAERRSIESHGLNERFRQTDVATVHTPLSLVLQRLREPERVLATQKETILPGAAAHPEVARHLADKVRRTEKLVEPAARVLREEASEPKKDRALTATGRESVVPDSWRGMPSAAFPVSFPAMPMAPAVNVEALTETVMHQIDQRLHAWRERRGGF